MGKTDIIRRMQRLYASLDATEVDDMQLLPAKVSRSPYVVDLYQDFSGNAKSEGLENDTYMLIHNIANVHDHLKAWATKNGQDKKEVDRIFEKSMALKIVKDLSNNDKHGYPDRTGGHSKLNPKLENVRRLMQLKTKAENGSYVQLTFGRAGKPQISGNGSGMAVTTGEIVDTNGKVIGDLRTVVSEAIHEWEITFAKFGIVLEEMTDG